MGKGAVGQVFRAASDIGKQAIFVERHKPSHGIGPATAMQHGLLLESTLAGRPWANLEQIIVEGPLPRFGPERLPAAWKKIADRHDALRMLLVGDGRGGISQQVLGAVEPEIDFHDIANLCADDQSRKLEAFLAQERLVGVDPAVRPGWRVTVFLKKATAVMVWTIHHALIDGTSMAIVLEELGDLTKDRPLAPLAECNFVEFSKAGPKQDKAAAKRFFVTMFAEGAESAPFVPAETAAAGRMSAIGQELDLHESDALRAMVRAVGATTLNAVQAAWALLLARWTGQAEACFGLVDSGRSMMPGLERTVGCLISTLPMRLQMDGDERLKTLLPRLRQTTLDMRRHSHCNLTEVRRWANLPGKAPLFDTIVMYAHASLSARIAALGGDWGECSVRLLEEGTAAITLAVADDPCTHVLLEYDPARVSDGLAKALLGQVLTLLKSLAAAGPETRLADLNMLSADERAELRHLGQPDTKLPFLDPPCIATRFETVATSCPDALAILDAGTGRTLSFRDLDREANALAHRLQQAGVRPEDIVALHLPRGADHISALLAVLKLGAAFLPLDPDLPRPWLEKLAARAAIKALVSGDPATGPLAAVVLTPRPGIGQDVAPARPTPNAARLAYVLYTSGSTGQPKAVRGLCGALSAHASAIGAAFALCPKDRVLQFAGLGFDVSLEEIVPTLLAGACVVIRDQAAAGSARGFLDLLDRHRVTVANLPASFWHVLGDEMSSNGLRLPAALRLVVTGSERIRPQALRRWLSLAPGVDWINGYGPTEATITATAFCLPAGHSLPAKMEDVPIGRPLAHANVAICAFDGSLTPKGGQGMLWIGGLAVTAGYLGDQPRTDAVFRPDPWGAGTRCYMTGDHARWRGDGMLDFLGRKDRQIKLRGQRIDLYQIERLISALPGVRQAHVAAVGQESLRLLAWVVPDLGVDIDDIAQTAAQTLPRAMLPQLIRVEKLPLSASGKVDAAALPIAPIRHPRPAAAPQSPLVQDIIACMAHVLERDEVPADVSFSDLGGDSLLALRLVSLIEGRTGHVLQTANLHQDGSAAGLAKMLQSGSTAPRYTIPIQPRGSKPAFFAIHVLGRNEDLFRPLAAALGNDYPVYGLSVGIPRNLDDISVERTARLYYDEIQTYHPTGPICLGAVSMAAYFAFELAQLLRAAGREVRVLAVLDAMGPDGRPSLAGVSKLRAHLDQVRQHGIYHFGRVAKHRFDRYRERREALHSAPDQVNAHNLIAANVCAVEFYQPKPYHGPLTVFRADHSFWDSPEAVVSGLGWASVAKGGFAMHDLPGTHLSILEPSNVHVLASHLKRLMDVN